MSSSLIVDIEMTKKACESALIEPCGLIFNEDGIDTIISENMMACLQMKIHEFMGLPVYVMSAQEELVIMMVKVKR